MKRNNYLIWGILVMGLFMGSCQKPETTALISDLSIEVSLPDGYTFNPNASGLLVDSLELRLKGVRMTYGAMVDSTGRAHFTDVLPDVYNIYGLKELSRQVTLSGERNQINIFTGTLIHLKLHAIVERSFLVSKIYFAGCKDDANRNYLNDLYIEFFNNSEDSLLLDSTYYFGIVEGNSPSIFKESLDPEHVYIRQAFRFFSQGMSMMLAPGQAIVVAKSATNHRRNASRSIDLSKADFEVKSTSVTNNPNIRGVIAIHDYITMYRYLDLIPGGTNGVIIFQTTEDVKQWPIFNEPNTTKTQYFLRVPNDAIIDGLEALKFSTGGVDRSNKRLSNAIDAGYMVISTTNGYTGESVERKATLRNGRYYLTDRNNSNEDTYVPSVRNPEPKIYAKP